MLVHWRNSPVLLGLREKLYWCTAMLHAVSSRVDDVIEDNILPTIAAAVTVANGGSVSVLRNRWNRVLEATNISSAYITSTSVPRYDLLRRIIDTTVIRRGNHADGKRLCDGPRSVRERANDTLG